MYISHLHLKNWRNFKKVDTKLQKRQFIVGPNASGKSNMLDALRFLRDIAKQQGGGLQHAISKRGGISKIRYLNARRDPEVIIGVTLSESGQGSDKSADVQWKYEICIKQETRGHRQPYVNYETVHRNGKKIHDRKESDKKEDSETRKQTHLEQVTENSDFRDISKFFNKIGYMHLVPQLLRHADDIQGHVLEDDPFGQGFLLDIARANDRIRKSRLGKINRLLQIVVPNLEDMRFHRDETSGRPHLIVRYKNWRPQGGYQQENQLSDGTLRFIATIWALLDGNAPLILEEPELSLHGEVVRKLPVLFNRAQRDKTPSRQILISTHSSDLLSDRGIDPHEILVLKPEKEGTGVSSAHNIKDIRQLLDIGAELPEILRMETSPDNIQQLELSWS